MAKTKTEKETMTPAGLEGFTPQVLKIKDSELVGKIKGYKEDAKSYQNKIVDLHLSYHKAYLGQLPAKSFPWKDCSNVDLGIVEMTVDNIKSRLKLSTILNDPFFTARPLTKTATDKKDDVQSFMSWVLGEVLRFHRTVDTVSQNVAEYGTAITKRRWHIHRAGGRFMGDVGNIQDLSKKIERAQVDVINRGDIIVPPDALPDVQACPFIFHRVWLSQSDLYKRVGSGPYAFSAEKVKVACEWLTKKIEKLTRTPSQSVEGILRERTQAKLEVLECYLPYSPDGGKIEEECFFSVALGPDVVFRKLLLKDIYFDEERPFNLFRYKDKGSFDGRGITEMLMGYRDAMNTIFNQGVDCAMLQILPWGFYKYASSLIPEVMKLSPGVFIPVDDIKDIRVGEFPATAGLSHNVVNMLMSFVERQTGISAAHMGKEFEHTATATEISAVMGEGSIKHQDRVSAFQEEMGELLKGIYHLYRQNRPKDLIIRAWNAETNSYSFDEAPPRESLREEFEFAIEGAMTGRDRAIEREEAMAFYGIMMKNPFVGKHPKAILEMTKDIIKAFGKRDIKRYLPDVDAISGMTEAEVLDKLRDIAGLKEPIMGEAAEGAAAVSAAVQGGGEKK